MQRRLRSISAKTVSVALNYLTYFSIILASTMGPLYSQSPTDYLLGEFADSIGHLSKGKSPRFSDTQREPSTYQPRDQEAS